MICEYLMKGCCIYDIDDGDIVLPSCAVAVGNRFHECSAYKPRYTVGSDDKGKPHSEGAERIRKERLRQITEEGYDDEHDDTHLYGDLAVYAAGLAVYGTDALVDDPKGRINRNEVDIYDDMGLIEKHKHDQVRMLEIAGALIAAELDRVLRQKG